MARAFLCIPYKHKIKVLHCNCKLQYFDDRAACVMQLLRCITKSNRGTISWVCPVCMFGLLTTIIWAT